jgi:hypothetical protein
VTRLGSFVADQASTVEVAITVNGIKGEVRVDAFNASWRKPLASHLS